MKAHPEKYKKYSSFKDAMSEELDDFWINSTNSSKERFKTSYETLLQS